MKKYLILTLLIATTVFSCEDSEIENIVVFDGEIELKHGQIIYSDKEASLEIVNINDSRCPSDVVCIWAGVAQVTFEFKNQTTTMFDLVITGKDTIDGYIFELIDVAPYPVSTQDLELDDYTITLEVSEL